MPKTNEKKNCVFNRIYSLDSSILTISSKFRINLGKQLAKIYPIKADIVVPIPETGIYSATGYSAKSKIPLYCGLIRDYFTKRTLSESTQTTRNNLLRRKLIAVPDIVKNKKVILIDEAIISGNTLRIAIKKLKKAEVQEIHVRIPSPSMVCPCNHNVLNSNAKLIAEKERDLRKCFKVNSLCFLSLYDFLKILKSQRICYECFKK